MNDLLNAIRQKIDTTKMASDDFFELCRGATFYAKGFPVEVAAEMAIEDVLSPTDRERCAL